MRTIPYTFIFAVACFCMLSGNVHAQGGDIFHFKQNKEAALATLKNYPHPDTQRVNALLQVARIAAFFAEHQEVTPYRTEAIALSRKLNYAKGLALGYYTTGLYLKSGSRYAEAIRQFDSALSITRGTRSSELLDMRSRIMRMIGQIHYTQGNYYSALDHFFEALEYEETHSPKNTIAINTFITDIYITLNNLEKASWYARQNITLVEKDTNTDLRSNVYFSYIHLCIEKKELDSALVYLAKIGARVPDSQQVQVNFGYYLRMGDVSYLQQQYPEAWRYYQEAYKYALQGKHTVSRSGALRGLSATAMKLGDKESAKRYALENLALTEGISTKKDRVEALSNLATYYAATGKKDEAVNLLQQAMEVKDSLMNEANLKQVNILGAIYEAEKKEKEISRLEQERNRQAADVQQKSMLNWIFLVSILVLLLVGYLGYSNFKSKQLVAKQQQALQKQKIIDLEKDKQLLTIDAMLKGQEDERSRIAKDLHDGVGSLLSGTKLSFMNIRENLVLTSENAILFDRSLSLLDNSMGDLRKVAQNLMPETLLKYGLHETLRDYCESMESTTGLTILYQFYGDQGRLDNTAEVFIYRMVQELIQNVVKHAEASQVIVQLMKENKKLVITVEDNGKGFDPGILSNSRGSGMANIKNRILYFNGTLDIVSEPAKGTSVNIELIV